MSATTCEQSWPAGIQSGLDIACQNAPSHRGWHRNPEHDIEWSGKLTQDEMSQRDQLRAIPRTPGVA